MSDVKPVFAQRWLDSLTRRPGLWAMAVIAASLAVRLWFVLSGQLDLVQDEAQYWDWSRRLQWSYYSKGPLIAWVIAFWTHIFGDTELGVRMGAIVNATLAQILLWYGVGRLMGRPRLAVLSLVVANTMPLFLAAGVLMTTDNILLVCWLGGLLCLYVLCSGPEETPRAVPLFLLGLCMAAGSLAKYMMLAQFAVAVPYFWLLHRQRLLPRGVAARSLAAMAAGALIGYAPILIWNMHNGWVGVLHVTTLAGVTGSGASRLLRLDTAPEFLGAQFGVASPWWMLLMLFAGWRAAKAAWNGRVEADDPAAELPPATGVRQAALMACGFWPLWLGMFVWSFHTRVYANWPGMSYVAGIILAAAGLERLLAGFGFARARRLAMLWPCLGFVVFLAVFGQNWLPVPPHLNPAARLKGWADLGRELAELTEGLPNPDKVFYFGSGYDVTAELAFYAPGQPVAYSADFGRRRSQYDLWPGPDEEGDKLIGWDAIYVNTSGHASRDLYRMFDSVTIIPYQSIHRGKPGRTFTIALLRNFNGYWPHSTHARY